TLPGHRGRVPDLLSVSSSHFGAVVHWCQPGGIRVKERREASCLPLLALETELLLRADACHGVTPVGVAELAESTNLERVVRARRQSADGHGYFCAGKSLRCPCRGRASAGRYRGDTHVVRTGARKR